MPERNDVFYSQPGVSLIMWVKNKEQLENFLLSFIDTNSYFPVEIVLLDQELKSGIEETVKKYSSVLFMKHSIINACNSKNPSSINIDRKVAYSHLFFHSGNTIYKGDVLQKAVEILKDSTISVLGISIGNKEEASFFHLKEKAIEVDYVMWRRECSEVAKRLFETGNLNSHLRLDRGLRLSDFETTTLSKNSSAVYMKYKDIRFTESISQDKLLKNKRTAYSADNYHSNDVEKNKIMEALKKAIKEADSSMKNKDWSEASEKWQLILNKYGNHSPVKVYASLSHAYHMQGLLDKAEYVAYLGLTLHDNNFKLACEYADIAMSQGNWPVAVKRWQYVLDNFDENLRIKMYVKISRSFFQIDAFQEAEIYLDQYLCSYPDNLNALLERKNQYIRRAYYTWRMWVEIGVRDWGLTWTEAQSYLKKTIVLCKNLLPKTSEKQNDTVFKDFVSTQFIYAEMNALDKDRTGAVDTVSDILNFYEGKLSHELLNNLKSYNENEQNEKVSQAIYELIENTEAKCLPCSRWLALYDILRWKGLFISGAVARQKAIEQSYFECQVKSPNSYYLQRACQAAIDQADFDLAYNFLEQLLCLEPNNTLIADLKDYYYLNIGDLNGYYENRKRPISRSDRLYYNYIEGKSVAIVGPAPDNDTCGEEIDSYDIVVRLNYFGIQSIENTKAYGSKANISYIKDLLVRKLLVQKQSIYSKEIDFYVFQTLRYIKVLSDYYRWQAKPIKTNKHLFYRNPHGIPRAVFDLFFYKPSVVKVFKSNFFITQDAYVTGYINENNSHNDLYAVKFNHDPLCQVSFIRNLWRCGVIDVDNGCENVLKMTDENYMAGLEKTRKARS